MSQESVERFLGRIITDDVFRKMAMGSMQLAIAAENFNLTRQEIAALELIDEAVIELLSKELDKSLKRSSAPAATPVQAENDAVWAVGAVR